MKKLLIIALFLLGMYNAQACPNCEAPALETLQEIILTELYSIMPLDDPGDDWRGEGPDPTQFRASISGNLLSIGAYTDMPAYVEVIDDETGEVVAEEEFEGDTEISVKKAGLYLVQIYSGNTIMTGEFEVE